MLSEPPFSLFEQNPISLRHAIVEQDDQSCWAYLTKPDSLEPVSDCWLYNTVPAPPPSWVSDYEGGPPPACEGVASSEALKPGVTKEHLRCVWNPDGSAVALLLNNTPLGFLTASEPRGYSRYTLRTSPWGNHFDEQKYADLFAG